LGQLTEFGCLARRIAVWLGRPTRNNAANDIEDLPAAVGTTIGEVRSENQDRAVIVRNNAFRSGNQSFLLFALCDGMGGMVDGARCAEITLAVLVESLVQIASPDLKYCLRLAADRANKEVYQRYQERGGTTLAALLFSGAGAGVGMNIGDSRIYTFLLPDRVRQISVDDTIAGEVKRFKGPACPDAEMGLSSDALAQFVGLGQGLDPRIYEVEALGPQVGYILTSDGAHSIPPRTFEQVVLSAPSAYALVTRLIQLSKWCGGKDNASVLCVGPEARSRLSTHPEPDDGLLEVWDSSGKLDVFLSTFAARQPSRPTSPAGPTAAHSLNVPEVVPPQAGGHVKQKKSPRTATAKTPARKRAEPRHDTPQQQTLTIEVVEPNATSPERLTLENQSPSHQPHYPHGVDPPGPHSGTESPKTATPDRPSQDSRSPGMDSKDVPS
jgi:serine/threonine protein phosphatase PrpC